MRNKPNLATIFDAEVRLPMLEQRRGAMIAGSLGWSETLTPQLSLVRS
ncbi:MAG TPA: hypothetical protein VE197_09385 [Mycobacterium sp.]|nr:hypothetical protein [Mycobacterium sp.]